MSGFEPETPDSTKILSIVKPCIIAYLCRARCPNLLRGSLIEEVAILFRQMRLGLLNSEVIPRPGLSQTSMSRFDNRIRQAINDVIPPFRLAFRVFESNIVLRKRGPHMHLRGDPNSHRKFRAAPPVCVEIGILRDPLQFGDSAHILRVRPEQLLLPTPRPSLHSYAQKCSAAY